jgi:hypothetical protein
MLAAFATGSSLALAASPVSGFVSGQVVSVKGTTFVVKNSFGTVGNSTVLLTGSTDLVKQVAARESDVKVGACVTAVGQRPSSGAVEAFRLTITAAVKGKCSTGLFGYGGGYHGSPPSGAGRTGAPPANFTGFGNFGFAAGEVIAVKGNTLTVHGENGSTTVALSSSTEITSMQKVGPSAIVVNECASVRGTSGDNGLTVKASNVNLSTPGTDGCNRGFRGNANA